MPKSYQGQGSQIYIWNKLASGQEKEKGLLSIFFILLTSKKTKGGLSDRGGGGEEKNSQHNTLYQPQLSRMGPQAIEENCYYKRGRSDLRNG